MQVYRTNCASSPGLSAPRRGRLTHPAYDRAGSSRSGRKSAAARLADTPLQELSVERLRIDAEDPGGAAPVPADFLEHPEDVAPFDLVERHHLDVVDDGLLPLGQIGGDDVLVLGEG